MPTSKSHREIKNGPHRQLDIVFREDQARMRLGHADEDPAVIRHIALNLLRSDRTKHLLAGWGENYLLRLVTSNLKL